MPIVNEEGIGLHPYLSSIFPGFGSGEQMELVVVADFGDVPTCEEVEQTIVGFLLGGGLVADLVASIGNASYRVFPTENKHLCHMTPRERNFSRLALNCRNVIGLLESENQTKPDPEQET